MLDTFISEKLNHGEQSEGAKEKKEKEGEGRRRARQSAKERRAPILCCEGRMGEPERREALLFFSRLFSLFFAQVKDPEARQWEIIIKGAHREGAKGESSSAENMLIIQRLNAPSRDASDLFD